MSDVIDFSTHMAPTTVRKAIDRYFARGEYNVYMARKSGNDPDLNPTDHMLAWLWNEGFKVVSLASNQPPATNDFVAPGCERFPE